MVPSVIDNTRTIFEPLCILVSQTMIFFRLSLLWRIKILSPSITPSVTSAHSPLSPKVNWRDFISNFFKLVKVWRNKRAGKWMDLQSPPVIWTQQKAFFSFSTLHPLPLEPSKLMRLNSFVLTLFWPTFHAVLSCLYTWEQINGFN